MKNNELSFKTILRIVLLTFSVMIPFAISFSLELSKFTFSMCLFFCAIWQFIVTIILLEQANKKDSNQNSNKINLTKK